MKINSIHIIGLRGVRNEIAIPLDSNSALFYGDNGTGKSTISDVLEWFFFDKVSHLSDGEIGKKGHNAMRNIALPDDSVAALKLNMSDLEFEPTKTIEVKSDKLVSQISNDDESIAEYMTLSANENFILRYKDLDDFARATKKDRLTKLSDIIGYSQITKIRGELQSTCSALKKEIKLKSFEDQISYQQSQILEQFARNTASDKQFFEAVNELVEPFDLKVSSFADVNAALERVKQADNDKEVSQDALLAKIQEKIILLLTHLDELESQYEEYKKLFEGMASNAEKLKNLILEKLLSSGREVLEDESYSRDECPLCLTQQDVPKLKTSIAGRLDELESVKKERVKLEELKKALLDQISLTRQVVDSVLEEKQVTEEENAEYKQSFTEIKNKLEESKKALDPNPLLVTSLIESSDLKINRAKVLEIQEKSKNELQNIRKEKASNPKLDAYNKIKIADNAYAQVRKLEQERATYNHQLETMETVHKEFRKLQKSSIGAFWGAFSERINDIFQFLNPEIKIENIRLVPVEENDELTGVTIEMDFLDMKGVSPPHKYLSESYQNCVGISFFLASVEAFNNQNKFIVFDDVISSFDAGHRKRFADLLIEQYEDYQLILLTHEAAWFEIVRNLTKGTKWLVKEIKYSDSDGTYMDEPSKDLKARIESKIKDSNKDNLGNDARKYLEAILKDIACNIEVGIPFKFNSENEDRMPYELLTAIKATLKKRNCSELVGNEVIDRLLSSTFIGNKDSHDSSYNPDLSDLKAFWQDICDFKILFFCGTCSGCISLKYYDNVEKKIRCKKGEVSYSWKK